MATVYSRIIRLQEEEKIPFKFHPLCITKIGRFAKDKWLEKCDILPPLIRSIEKYGTYLVFDYPEAFLPIIDSLVADYVRIITEKANRNKQEKATKTALLSKCSANAEHLLKVPTQRKRKRVPFYRAINNTSN